MSQMSDRVHLAETDPLEIEATKRVMEILQFVDALADVLDGHRRPRSGSAYERDKALCPECPSIATAHHLLMAAQGTLASMRRALDVKESETSINMSIDLHGVYELLRGALETSGRALWLTSPAHPRKRANRTLLLLKEEQDNKIKMLEALGRPPAEIRVIQAESSARLRGYAERAGISPWPGKGAARGDIWADHPVKSTRVLQYVSQLHQAPNLSIGYYPAWCMASGISHGQQWAFHLLNDQRNLNMELMEAQMTGSFQNLHALMQSSAALLEVAVRRHIALCTLPTPGAVEVRALVDLTSAEPDASVSASGAQ
ncbi:hypothetical protein AB0H79_09740 [Micrococcus luteus]|uniref:hypothetical protein n=1 Tax=Micrococcus luteus TaxID=1270 RepID=UPI0033E8C2DB